MKHFFLLPVLCFGISAFALAQERAPDSAAKLVSAPVYAISVEDEAAGITGTMKLVADINKNGDVTLAMVYVAPEWPCSLDSGKRVDQIMRDAEKIVKTYKFSPAIKDGAPRGSRVSISMTIGKAAREAKLKEAKATEKAQETSVALPKTIQGGVVNGKALSLPVPIYPAEAKLAGQSGQVRVQILINEAGKVISAQAVVGPPLLQMAARAAACGAKFSPTLLSGTPVKVSGFITYNFNR
jgi:TonB family protein